MAGVVINARDITDRRARLERQTAISDLGREVLRATTLQEAFESAVAAINRIVRSRQCRIVDVPEDDVAAVQRAQGVGAGKGAAEATGLHQVFAFQWVTPEQPLAYIEVFTGDVTTPEDEQFVEAVSGIVLSAKVRFGAEDAIRHQAMHDPLTGLPNRALFNDRLEHALSRRARFVGHVAVMIVDLDGFKNVNDSLGHVTGDALLIAVADRFAATLRGFDTIARLGGDEFAILVDDLNAADQAGLLAQRVLDALASPLDLS